MELNITFEDYLFSSYPLWHQILIPITYVAWATWTAFLIISCYAYHKRMQRIEETKNTYWKEIWKVGDILGEWLLKWDKEKPCTSFVKVFLSSIVYLLQVILLLLLLPAIIISIAGMFLFTLGFVTWRFPHLVLPFVLLGAGISWEGSTRAAIHAWREKKKLQTNKNE